MKLGTKLLLAPVLTAVVALGGGGVNAWMAAREATANAASFKNDFGDLRTITQAQEQFGKLHAGVYKTVTLIGSMKDAEVNAYRKELKSQVEGVQRVVAATADNNADDAEIKAGAAQIGAELTKYLKQADMGVDLASVDPNTGIASLQGADASFGVVAKALATIVGRIDAAATDSLTASADRSRHVTWLIVGLSLLATAGTLVASARMLRAVVRELHEASRVAQAVAAGDLGVSSHSTRSDELGELQRALGDMVRQLRDSLGTVGAAADSIAHAGSEIASGNQDLSQRTEQTASNLQQAASAMEELTGAVRQSADSAAQASALAQSAQTVARRGGAAVSQVVATMDEITVASRKISDIIGVIDGIAFQTNILALNAAVEAARAGEQGRGFAVVASEVRSLAGRSAEAAREIKSLIGASVERVEAGTRQVKDAGATMSEIVESVQRVTAIIGEVTVATSEQSQGIGNVNGTVNQLDQMTQQNAALVEQSAAAAEQLKDQASALTGIVARFRFAPAQAGA
jgi:methyl-accepting chemotaxis protein